MNSKLAVVAVIVVLLIGSVAAYTTLNPKTSPNEGDDKFTDMPTELDMGMVKLNPEVIDVTPGHSVGGAESTDYIYLGFQNIDGYIVNMYYLGYINNTAIDIVPESKQIAQGGELTFEKTDFEKTTVTNTVKEVIKNPAKTSQGWTIASKALGGAGSLTSLGVGIASIVAGAAAAPVTGGTSLALGLAIATTAGTALSIGSVITGEVAESKKVDETVKILESQTIEEKMKSYTIGSKIPGDKTTYGHSYVYGAIGDLEIVQLEIYDKKGNYVDTSYTFNTLDFKGYGWIDYAEFLSQKTIEVNKIQEDKVRAAYADRLVIYKNSPVMDGSDAAHPIYLDKNNFYEKFIGARTGHEVYYKLTEDIDWNPAWGPIGNANSPFTGGFDGSYYNINGLRVVDNDTSVYKLSHISKNTNEYNFSGMFGAIQSAEVCNLVFNNPTVMQKMYAEWTVLGVVAGLASNSSIHDIYVSGGTVAHTNDNPGTAKSMIAGGIVGIMINDSKIEDCIAEGVTVRVNGKIAYAGDIVGSMELGKGLVSHCVASDYNTTAISDSKDKEDDAMSALIGAMKFEGRKTVEHCYVLEGTHTAKNNEHYVAALVGWIFASTNGQSSFLGNYYYGNQNVYGEKSNIEDSQAMHKFSIDRITDEKFYQGSDIIWKAGTYTLSWKH